MFLLNRIFDENEEEILRGIYLFLKFVPEEVYCNLDANKMFDFGQLLEGIYVLREKDWLDKFGGMRNPISCVSVTDCKMILLGHL